MKLSDIDFKSHKELLSSINQEKVWFNIVGNVRLEQFILNPLREDKHAGSCRLIERNGTIFLHDWASKEYSWKDCISTYCELHPYKSWKEVCYDLLNMSRNNIQMSYMSIPGIKKEKKIIEYKPIYRDWSLQDKKYWSKRGVHLEQLERKSTYTKPIKGFYKYENGVESKTLFGDLCYCYHFNNKVKMYFPNKRHQRFEGNQTHKDIWEIQRDKTLLISKSNKDMLVLENIVPFSITHVQAEEYGFPPNEKIFEWETYYNKVIIFLDNDNAGIKGATRLGSMFIYIQPEIIYIDPKYDIKDIDEMYCQWGEQETIDYLNSLL